MTQQAKGIYEIYALMSRQDADTVKLDLALGFDREGMPVSVADGPIMMKMRENDEGATS